MFRKVHTAGKPKFKRKSRPVQSYSTSNHYSSATVKKHGGTPSLYNGSIKFLDHNHIQLPKLGSIKVKLHRSLPTNRLVRIATVTIKHYATGQWTVSLLLKSDEPFHQALPNTNQAVGIDLNTENFPFIPTATASACGHFLPLIHGCSCRSLNDAAFLLFP